MKKNIFFLIFIAVILSCSNRVKENTKFNKNNIGYIFNKPSEPKGLVVIFPKFGNDVSTTEFETKIDEALYQEGYATLILDYKEDFILNQEDFVNIYDLINKVVNNNNIPTNKIIIGGFSIGGTIALSYSIWVKKLMKKNEPQKIFVGDSPVDLLSFYKTKKAFIEKKDSTFSKDGAKYIIKFLNYALGDPNDNMEKYLLYSPYIKSNINLSNFKYLKDFSIRFYSEPDLKWYKDSWGYEYTDTNSFQIERLVNELKKTNNNIDYIKTKNKGFINGIKNPHSWSIIDEKEFVKWVLK